MADLDKKKNLHTGTTRTQEHVDARLEHNEEHFYRDITSEPETVQHYCVLHQCPTDCLHMDISNMLCLQKDKTRTS